MKLDFTPEQVGTSAAGAAAGLPGWFAIDGRRLLVGGTDGADTITLFAGNKSFDVTRNGETVNVMYDRVDAVEIYAKGGDDVIDANVPTGVYVHAGDGNDTVAGGFGPDVLTGGDGDDQLVGRGGDDRLNGNSGRDVLIGSGGNDRLYGGPHRDQLLGGAGRDQLFGENGDDLLLGGNDNDVLFGGNHDDALYGQRGDDRHHGQNGDDLIGGDAGTDLHDGGRGRDILSYEFRTRGVYVSPTHDYTRVNGNDGEPGERDHVLDNIETIVGGLGDDTLAGAAGGGAVLYGLAGNDELHVFNDLFDHVDGGEGEDEAYADFNDSFHAVEGVTHVRL